MEAITGDKALDRKLDRLDAKTGKRVGRRAVTAGLRVTAKAIKAEVPATTTPGHKRRNIQRSVGTRHKRNKRTGIQEAKAGIGVGTASKWSKEFPHNHLLALGTKNRFTGARTWKIKGGVTRKSSGKRRAFRGRVVAEPFVKRAAIKSKGDVKSKMRASVKANMEREAAKA